MTVGNNMFFSAASLEYAELFGLNYLQNIQHLAWKVSHPTVEFLAKNHSHKVKYQATLTMEVASSMHIDLKDGKRGKVASCNKTEPADDSKQGTLQKAPV